MSTAFCDSRREAGCSQTKSSRSSLDYASPKMSFRNFSKPSAWAKNRRFQIAVSGIKLRLMNPQIANRTREEERTHKADEPRRATTIDLRSDTVTKPTPDMRRAMAE